MLLSHKLGVCLCTYRTYRNLGQEPITMLRNCLDPLSFETFSKHSPQQRNIASEISFFDEGVRPYGSHDFVFTNQMTALAHKQQQQIECFGLKWNRMTIE